MLGVQDAVPMKMRSMSPDRAGFWYSSSSSFSPVLLASRFVAACCTMGWYRCRMSWSPSIVLFPSVRYRRAGYCSLTLSKMACSGDFVGGDDSEDPVSSSAVAAIWSFPFFFCWHRQGLATFWFRRFRLGILDWIWICCSIYSRDCCTRLNQKVYEVLLPFQSGQQSALVEARFFDHFFQFDDFHGFQFFLVGYANRRGRRRCQRHEQPRGSRQRRNRGR
mmetsp:Transcript_30358/g.71596  ORF Transcript_30358/g.71596 Transcript_30358/m.71596 type:complete len:220 (-) Transcript_30358:671-1330(-)